MPLYVGYNKEIGRLLQAIPQKISVIYDVVNALKYINIFNCKSVYA